MPEWLSRQISNFLDTVYASSNFVVVCFWKESIWIPDPIESIIPKIDFEAINIQSFCYICQSSSLSIISDLYLCIIRSYKVMACSTYCIQWLWIYFSSIYIEILYILYTEDSTFMQKIHHLNENMMFFSYDFLF